jgi:hypothetical protein
MSMHIHVTLEIASAAIDKFLAAMPEAVEFLESQAGWRLAGAYVQRTGRLYTVIDLWELQDMNHYDRGFKQLVEAAFFPAFKAMVDEAVLRETIVFVEKAPYMR